MTIDVVITWVDGQDEQLAARRAQYAGGEELKHDDVGGVTRYASLGEIKWCLASINRFAPWVHRIFIVTDGQDPHVTPFLETYFPDGYIPVEVVDHKQIFRDFESYLPTFNSLAIETMLWRIPGLSRHFIEMNDDFMFTAPVSPSDFFVDDDTPVCFASLAFLPLTRLTRSLKRRKDGTKRLTFKGNMIAAADVIGDRWSFYKITHTPRALLRDAFEECLGQHPELIVRNIRHRFRSAEQFNVEELHYLHLRRKHHVVMRNPDPMLFYLQPKRREGYVTRKLARLQGRSYKFSCFNGLNLAREEDLCAIKNAIAGILDIAIP